MESQLFPSRKGVTVVYWWADLPPEILEIIACGLQFPIDITRFRSICRSWRFSIPPPPSNKLSPFYPLRTHLTLDVYRQGQQSHIIAGTVYLFRHPVDPSKAWMVSLHESESGKLLLRHALTGQKIARSSGIYLNLLECRVAEIARFYSHGKFCKGCDQTPWRMKVVFVSKSDLNHDFVDMGRDLQLMYNCTNYNTSRSIDGADPGVIEDFVNFKGRIYFVDASAYVYVFDSKTLQLNRMSGDPEIPGWLTREDCRKRLVVSDGELHVFWRLYDGCVLLKLVMDGINVTQFKWESVKSLGDKVLFINRNCSFSLSARVLPHPWKGNCIVVMSEARGVDGKLCGCGCSSYEKEIQVIDLGVWNTLKQCRMMLSLEGYFDLFTPAPFILDEGNKCSR